jgi:hypothetical protein
MGNAHRAAPGRELMVDQDLHRLIGLLTSRYGNAAVLHAQLRLAELSERGDAGAAVIWRQVAQMLQAATPSSPALP